MTPFLKIAHLAEGQNRRITVHGIEELHAHLLAAIPNKSMVMMNMLNGEFERYKLSHLRLVDGKVLVPDTPGHGLELDREHRAEFLVKS